MAPNPETDVVLVWTMGRVGTTSLDNALSAAGVDCHRCHYLNPAMIAYEIAEAEGRADRLEPDMRNSIVLRHFLPNVRGKRRLKIITSMRDPVARNVSAFFANLPDFRCGGKTRDEYVEVFLRKYPHTIPLEWWDFELRDVLGLNLLSEPFDRDAGFTIYEMDWVDVFVMRADLPLETQGDAVSAFLGRPVEIQRLNGVAGRREVASAYAEFLEGLALPRDYLALLYEAAIVSHLWGRDQIQDMRGVWSETDAEWRPHKWQLAQVAAHYSTGEASSLRATRIRYGAQGWGSYGEIVNHDSGVVAPDGSKRPAEKVKRIFP